MIANPDCLIIRGSVSKFLECIGQSSFTEVETYSTILQSLIKVPLFKNFSQAKLEKLSKVAKIQTYNHGDIIIKQGQSCSNFYIVKKGKIDIQVNNNYIRTLNENEFLGERSLFINEKRSATAISNQSTEVYVIKKEDFVCLLENNLKEHLLCRIFLQDESVMLQDLDFIRELGKGSYGSVCLVQNRKNKFFYAIKSMPISKIYEEKLDTYIDLEKSILLKIDHPFIMKLVKTIKDSYNIYFLSEYIKGKELFEVIRTIGIVNKQQTQFFAASIISAIDYLHKRNIIYRDVKPENIVVTEKVKQYFYYRAILR